MEERTLLGIALICMILGIPALWIFSVIEETGEQPTPFLENEKTVTITGKIMKVTQKEDVTFLEIEQKSLVPVLMFDNVSFEKGMEITALGKVDTYQGKKEIIAEEIRRK